jgi:hypothetical protein
MGLHPSIPTLLLALVLLSTLSGCTSRPLAADAEPDRPSVPDVQREGTTEAVAIATLSLTAVPLPGLDRLCLLVGRDADVIDNVTSGVIVLFWEAQAAAPELQVDAIGAHTATAKGGNPVILEWTKETGPAALPFLVEVSLSGPTPAIEQEVQFLAQVESTAPSIEILEGPCS